MRILSSTLLAAQKSVSRIPYVKVEVSEKVANITRFLWERLYVGTEGDFYHAATMPGDGSLLRARVHPSTYQLYYQRVPNPGPSSDYSAWTGMGTVSSASGMALCVRESTVLLFYVGTDQTTIYCRESTNNGATFGDAVAVVTAASAVGWLAAAINPSNTVALFYSVGATVYVVKRISGTWGSPSAWSQSFGAIRGLACVHQGDFNLLVTGLDASNNAQVWSCLYGDGYSLGSGSWSSLRELTRASSGSNVEFRCPFLDFPDVFRAFWVEKYTGTVAYSRPYWSHAMPSADFIDGLWREGVPFDLFSTYGVALAHGGSYAWLTTPNGVWRAALMPASVELTEDVLRLVARSRPTMGQLEVELRNDDGRYLTLGSGTYAAIKEVSQVAVSPGYRTSVGNECSFGPAYWLEGWEYLSEGGRASLVLRGRDGWGLLDEWRARRQFRWAAGEKNVFQLLSFVLARAGLECASLSNSSVLTDLYPSFAIYAGESGATAVQRLLALVPDVLFFRGSVGYLRYPQASDTTDYAYGTDHPLIQGRYRTEAQGSNRVQVFGDGVFNEGFAWTQVNRTYDRLLQAHDLNLNDQTKAQARADALLREAALAASGGAILVPTNCGQELYDAIAITDGRAGLSGAKRRVAGLTLEYVRRRREPTYQQQIELMDV